MYKTQETVIRELRHLFDIDNNLEKGTVESNGKFFINKQHLDRSQVLSMLRDYFDGVGVENGYVNVNPITFVFTYFEVCNGTPS